VTFCQKSLGRANHHVLFSRVTLSSGSAGMFSRTVRVLTSTKASVLPS
jgi:hypothetical protein